MTLETLPSSNLAAGNSESSPATARGEAARFRGELAAWGPDAPPRPVTLSEAEAYCRQLATTHYENFPVVSWLLPKWLHQHFYNVYAYCRWSDDLGDEVESEARALLLLSWWRGELEDCYRDKTRHPVFVALRKTIQECCIPIEPFADLLSAFEQDQRIKEYETFEQLQDYCRRSADPVGRLVLYMAGVFSEENAAWSDSICTGLQLANFWQDVARDAEIGRTYLPREDRARFEYGDVELKARLTNESFLTLMRFEVERARQFLNEGLPLVERLPGRLQIDIELFARGGLCILDRIEEIGYRVWETRPKVSKLDFARLATGCLARAVWRRLKVFVSLSTPGR